MAGLTMCFVPPRVKIQESNVRKHAVSGRSLLDKIVIIIITDLNRLFIYGNARVCVLLSAQ